MGTAQQLTDGIEQVDFFVARRQFARERCRGTLGLEQSLHDRQHVGRDVIATTAMQRNNFEEEAGGICQSEP